MLQDRWIVEHDRFVGAIERMGIGWQKFLVQAGKRVQFQYRCDSALGVSALTPLTVASTLDGAWAKSLNTVNPGLRAPSERRAAPWKEAMPRSKSDTAMPIVAASARAPAKFWMLWVRPAAWSVATVFKCDAHGARLVRVTAGFGSQ